MKKHENVRLTAMLAEGTLYDLFTLAANESQREQPRGYIAERVMKRIQRRIADVLYEAPTKHPIKRGETVDKYIRRLYDIALRADVKEA